MRVRVDGNLYELSEEIKLEKNKKHNIEIVVDRLVVKPGIEKRLTDSMENVLALADGLVMVDVIDGEPMQFQPELFLPGLRHQHRGDRAEKLFLQQSLRRLPGLFRTWVIRWNLTRI